MKKVSSSLLRIDRHCFVKSMRNRRGIGKNINTQRPSNNDSGARNMFIYWWCDFITTLHFDVNGF